MMKLLIIGLLLVTSIGCTGSTEDASSSTVAASGATSDAPTSSGAPVSTISGATDASTQAPTTTTTAKLDLTTLPIQNAVQPKDAKLILQHAYQLNQQIQSLNAYLIQAQLETDPNNSPLFAQLDAFSQNITGQNATLQGYIGQLQTLQSAQDVIDTQLNSALDTFTCFSQSSCVTDVPTTPEPTSPGPTPSVQPCTNSTLTASLTDSQSFNFDSKQNVALCTISVKASEPTNNVSVTIDTKLGGDSFVRLVETRTQRTISVNTTQTGANFNAFQQIDVFYFADPRATIQFNFTYVEVDSCTLDCSQPNGTCKTSQSGVQYCECEPCKFEGDHCEKPLASPCLGKQNRACKKSQGFGECYVNPCFDQCWACNCAPNAVVDGSPQTCDAPDGQTPAPFAPTLPPDEIKCPTTAAPTTTAALFTTTPAVTNPPTTTSGAVTTGASDSTDAASTSADASTSSAPLSSTTCQPPSCEGEEI